MKAQKCRRSDYCYANSPILFLDFCITIVTAFTFLGQSASNVVSKCSELNGLQYFNKDL